MCLGDRVKDPGAIRLLGITLIAFAILSGRFLRHSTGPLAGAGDFLTGLLYGMALALLGWSLFRVVRGRPGKPD